MNSQYRKLLYRELHVGIRMRNRAYFALACYAIMICLVYYFQIVHYFQKDNQVITPTSGDFLLHFLGGGLPQNHISKDSFYTMPIIWFATFFFIFLINGQYVRADFSACGYQYFIRIMDKRMWWISKVCWLSISVSLCFLIKVAVSFIFGILLGNSTMLPTREINQVFHEVDTLEYTVGDVIVKGLIVPMIMTAGFCEFQILLSFMINDIFSIVVLMIILIVSSSQNKYYLLGNYIMAFRDKKILGEEGIFLVYGIIVGILLFGASMIGGYYIFKKKDVI